MEQTVQKPQDKIALQNHSFVEVASDMRQMCHEMSQPMMTILGYMDLIQMEIDTIDNRRVRQYFNCLIGQVDDLGRIFSRLRKRAQFCCNDTYSDK